MEAGHSYQTVAVPGGHANLSAKGILNPFREGCFILLSSAFEITSASINAFNKSYLMDCKNALLYLLTVRGCLTNCLVLFV